MNLFKSTSRVLALAFILFITTATSCKKKTNIDDPQPPDEQELITNFIWVLTDSATNVSTSYSFNDPDGAGGVAAFYGPGTSAGTQADSVIVLKDSTTYYGRIVLLNSSTSPVDSISNEVLEKGTEHHFFYNNGSSTITNSGVPYTVKLTNGTTIRYTDSDNGTPSRSIGLRTRIRTATTAKGSKLPLQIVLKHQPGVKDGTYAPGETDIEVNFKLKVN